MEIDQGEPAPMIRSDQIDIGLLGKIRTTAFTRKSSLGGKPAAMPARQRKFVRHQTVERSKLVTDSGVPYSCIIRDLSAGGAMLRVPANAQIDGRVFITSEALGSSRAADVRWRDETSIGVAFAGL